jgi:hypothetical protein
VVVNGRRVEYENAASLYGDDAKHAIGRHRRRMLLPTTGGNYLGRTTACESIK